jgi:hypothetical protein
MHFFTERFEQFLKKYNLIFPQYLQSPFEIPRKGSKFSPRTLRAWSTDTVTIHTKMGRSSGQKLVAWLNRHTRTPFAK